jgi:hypothetical protein
VVLANLREDVKEAIKEVFSYPKFCEKFKNRMAKAGVR